jgi:hypothetical protein
MINTLPTNSLDNISRFDHAVFYCINSASERIPVSIVSDVSVLSENRLEFSVSHFPVLENNWNIFSGELHFYKKGVSFNLNVHGTAWFTSADELTVQFKVLYIESFGQPETKHYSFQDTLVDFFSNTSLLIKKMVVTGL